MKRLAGRIDIKVALVSVGLSVFLWYMALPTWMLVRTRRFIVPLQIDSTQLDKLRLYLVNAPKTVTVFATVSQAEYDTLSKGPSADAVLSRPKAGTNSYAISLEPPELRNRVDPRYLQTQITLGAITENPNVRVRVVSSGKLSDPAEILNAAESDTKSVDIEGPADEVRRVAYARAMLRLDAVTGTSVEPQAALLEAVDDRDRTIAGVRIHPNTVLVTPRFSIAPQEKRVFVEATFGPGKAADGFIVKTYSVDPPSVNVSGSSQALSRITSVKTEPIDVSNLAISRTFKVNLVKAGDLQISPDNVTVTVEVQQLNLNRLTSPGSPPSSGSSSPGSPGVGRGR